MPHCDECGYEYGTDTDTHLLFCEARTCAICLNTFTKVLVPNYAGVRICWDCQRKSDEVEMEYDSNIEGDDDGATQA